MADDETDQPPSTLEIDPMRDAGIPVEESQPPAGPSEPVQPVVPSVETQLQEMREAVARLEGENRVLREQPRQPAQPTSQPQTFREQVMAAVKAGQVTAEQAIRAVEEAWKNGSITEEAERIELITDIKVEKAFTERSHADRQAVILKATQQKISTYLETYPRLQEATSEEYRKVSDKLNELEDEGWNRQDPRVQARALELALGPLKETTIMPTREYDRLRRPVGGGGGQPTVAEPVKKTKSIGEALWERITPDYQQDLITLRGSKEAAIKTLGYADEARLRRKGLLKA